MDEQLTFDFDKRPVIKGFPELWWRGKRPYESTQYYPAQLRERYGDDKKDWINKIYWGDNLQVMSHLMRDYRGKVSLVYIDPPFDSKADYKKSIEIKNVGKAESDTTSFEEKQYGDIWTNDEYLQFMYERLLLLRELLSDTGCIYLHCDWHKAHHLRMLMDEVFGPDRFVNEVIWHYSGAGTPKGCWAKRHDNIFVYSKTSSFTFNADEVRTEYAETTKERFSHAINNVRNGINFGSQTLNPLGKYPEDVLDVSIEAPSASIRTGYPTQKPEALIEKIIKASSNPGDIVFDCFMGSGTTQAVAMKLGRRFIGADINLGAIQTTTKRLISVAKELESEKNEQFHFNKEKGKIVKYEVESSVSMVAEGSVPYGGNTEVENSEKSVEEGEDIKYTGFEVYNVNNYDFFRNPIEARELIIQALEIQPFPQNNVWDGELDGRMVKIMPVNRIATKADLEELKANLPYTVYEKRREENPAQPVERITIVCMGHEPDLKASLEQELSDYKLDIEIVDILRDKKDLQLKREAEAEIVKEANKLVIRSFYPMNLMQKLSLQKEYVEDWRQLVESIMIDWNYDGVVMQPTVTDVPGKKEIVQGIYDIPEDAGTIKVKITDLLSESLEMEVE